MPVNKEIKIHTHKAYSVIIGQDLISCAGELITDNAAIPAGTKTAVITDTHVADLYLQSLTAGLEDAGLETYSYIIPAGEAAKNISTYGKILEFLAERELSRTDLLIALGGGVVGDMAGFAAATYLRGIGYIGIPTTLLAAVDSSVGGKTAIDLSAGKNLAGAFHQPRLVICDTRTLMTLPPETVRDGLAEVIKYAVIGDRDLFNHLSDRGPDFDRDYCISRSVEMKRDIVEEDELDLGIRQLLNFGHTLAHAAEYLSGFTLSHGHAVAAGMAHMMRAAAGAGVMPRDEAARAEALIARMGLPTHFDYGVDELMRAIPRDKKRRGDIISLVISHAIGDARVEDMTMEEAADFIKRGV